MSPETEFPAVSEQFFWFLLQWFQHLCYRDLCPQCSVPESLNHSGSPPKQMKLFLRLCSEMHPDPNCSGQYFPDLNCSGQYLRHPDLYYPGQYRHFPDLHYSGQYRHFPDLHLSDRHFADQFLCCPDPGSPAAQQAFPALVLHPQRQIP